MEKLFRDKKVLITGASRGLGRSLCYKFASEGADVAFNYSSDVKAAEETLREIQKHGNRALSFQVSVIDSAGINSMVKQIEEQWEGIDILINNAGISQPLPLALLEEEDWDNVMDINVKGTFLVSKSVLRGMTRRKSGVILNIGSLAGSRMIEAPIHYYTSKAAVKGFTEVLAKEMSRYGIRILCLAPGLLEGGVGNNLPDHRLKDYLKHCSLGRLGTFNEVADFAAFLVSHENSYMSGETIIMDGGI